MNSNLGAESNREVHNIVPQMSTHVKSSSATLGS